MSEDVRKRSGIWKILALGDDTLNMTSKFQQGVNIQRWNLNPYITIKFTYHDLKVKTSEMAYH